MNIEISETYLLIKKNKEWLEANADRRNSVYYQMVENTLGQLEEHLDFLEQYEGV